LRISHDGGDMDADALVEKAHEAIKARNYVLAKKYLKEAASLAPLRSDIREMLEFTLQQRIAAQPQPQRPLFRAGRNRSDRSDESDRSERSERSGPSDDDDDAEDAPRAAAPLRRRFSLFAAFMTLAFLILVAGLGVIVFLLMRPGLVHLPSLGAQEGPTTASLSNAPEAENGGERQPTETLASVDSLLAQSKYRDAVQTLKAALEGDSPDRDALAKRLAEVRFSWGKVLVNDLEFDEAAKNLEAAAQSDPQNADLHFWLGQAYLGKARRQEKHLSAEKSFQAAERAFKESTRLDPDMLKSYNALGLLQAAQAQPVKAARYFREVIDRAPESPEATRARNLMKTMDLK
jgi:tetratricopeptide (TPR) repeat protein